MKELCQIAKGNDAKGNRGKSEKTGPLAGARPLFAIVHFDEAVEKKNLTEA